MKYALYTLIALVIISGVGLLLINPRSTTPPTETSMTNTAPAAIVDTPAPAIAEMYADDALPPDASVQTFDAPRDTSEDISHNAVIVKKGSDTDRLQAATTTTSDIPRGTLKEFTMTAYYDDRGVWYSLKEITVNKGDTVRLKVMNTKGMHDFNIDEYGINKELPLQQEVVIEFVADTPGSFVYYCSKPNHRARGQWGTLRVLE